MALKLRLPSVAPRGGLPPTEQAQARVTDAEQAVQEAEDSRLAAILAHEAGDCTLADVEAAEAALSSAKAELARRHAVLDAATMRDAAELGAARRAREAANDAATVDAFDALAKAAREIEKAAAVYVDRYNALIDACTAMHKAAEGNPRVREDVVLAQAPKRLVAIELARASEGRLAPPGTSGWASASDMRRCRSISEHFGELAACIRRELGQ